MSESPTNVARYRFGDLLLEAGSRRLTRAGLPVNISKLTFDFLLVLVESWPNVVSYQELQERVWNHRYTTPETVSQRVTMLRKALGDHADDPRYIEVIRGHGCRLIPRVEVLPPPWSTTRRDTLFGAVGAFAAFAVTLLYWSYSGSSLAPLQRTFEERLEAMPPGDDPEIMELYSRALDLWRGDGIRSVGLTFADERLHDYLDQIIAREPEFSNAYGLKARAYADALIAPFPADQSLPQVRAEQESLAWEYANRALAIDAETTHALLAIAKIRQHNRDWEVARAAYAAALDSDPDHLGVLTSAAFFHAYLGEDDAALVMANRALEEDLNNPVVLYHVGVVHGFAGRTDQAIDAFNGAVELNPGYAAARSWLGNMTRIAGDGESAAVLFEQSASITKLRKPPRLLNLAAGYYALGMHEEAVELAEILDQASKEWHFGAAALGMIHLMRDERASALEWFQRAADTLEPDHDFVVQMIIKHNVMQLPVLNEPEFVAVRQQLGRMP